MQVGHPSSMFLQQLLYLADLQNLGAHLDHRRTVVQVLFPVAVKDVEAIMWVMKLLRKDLQSHAYKLALIAGSRLPHNGEVVLVDGRPARNSDKNENIRFPATTTQTEPFPVIILQSSSDADFGRKPWDDTSHLVPIFLSPGL